MKEVARRARGLWAAWSLVPFGWLTPIGLTWAAARGRMPWLYAVAAAFLAAIVVELVIVEEVDVGALAIGVWVAGVAVSVALIPTYRRRVGTVDRGAIAAAEARIEERRELERLAAERPEVARELGVGRPDRPGAQHGGLVDVNGAPVAVVETLPGVDRALAERIATTREEIDGFSSVDEVGHLLDLPADTVEDLRGRVVFLPR